MGLVIQRAGWGESTGKKEGEEKPQETFCTIQETEKPLDRQLPFPLKPETFMVHSPACPPSGASEENCSGLLGKGFPALQPSLGASQRLVPHSLEPGAPMWLELE